MFLDYFALIVMIVVSLILIYAAIYIHDIPYEMAKKRNHPHQDAIHVGGWLSLFTLHAIWPFLWIWATLYKPETGYGFASGGVSADIEKLKSAIKDLQVRISELESQHKDGEQT
jgi:hypothetical protein